MGAGSSDRLWVSFRAPAVGAALVAGALALFAALGLDSAGAANGTSVASGSDFSCAVTETGGVMCWGYSATGQLGNGVVDGPDICGGGLSDEYPCSKSPVQVTGLTSGVEQVAAGNAFACALMTGGTVKCWGRNDLGQLGSGGLGPDTCQDFFGGRMCSMTPVDVMGLTGVERVEAGVNHACALTTGGGVKCWGYGALAQLGDTGPDNCDTTECALAPIDTAFASGVEDLAVGGLHTCVVVGGSARCWGDNEQGQLGSGVEGPDDCFAGRTIPCSEDPVQVQGLTSGVTDITAGVSHTCALVGGATKCWGDNTRYQLARDEPSGCNNVSSECFSRTPVTIPGVSGDMIDAGEDFTCVSSGATIQCWGRNSFGQLDGGFGPDDCPGGFQCSKAPVGPTGIAGDIAGMALGGSHTCVLLETGTVQCWGDGFYGQMGTGDGEDGHVATIPTGFEGAAATPSPSGTVIPCGGAGDPCQRELPWGDADCNGSIGARDNQSILRIVLAQNPLSQTQPCFAIGSDVLVGNFILYKWADADCNGVIAARDNQAVLRFVLGQAPLSQTEPCPDVGSAAAVPDTAQD